jgi:hypothetical protein
VIEQTFKTGKDTNKVIGGIGGGFFTFYCEKCGGRVKVRYLGQELMVPKFESFCKCGEMHQFKAIITDIPNNKTENNKAAKPNPSAPNQPAL